MKNELIFHKIDYFIFWSISVNLVKYNYMLINSMDHPAVYFHKWFPYPKFIPRLFLVWRLVFRLFAIRRHTFVFLKFRFIFVVNILNLRRNVASLGGDDRLLYLGKSLVWMCFQDLFGLVVFGFKSFDFLFVLLVSVLHFLNFILLFLNFEKLVWYFFGISGFGLHRTLGFSMKSYYLKRLLCFYTYLIFFLIIKKSNYLIFQFLVLVLRNYQFHF